MKKLLSKKILIATAMVVTAFTAHAQYLRTSYFMESASTRTLMNPGLQPTRGYFNLPVIGSFNITANSNALGINDMINIFQDGNDFLDNNSLYNSLKTDNNINFNLNTDILSFGWIKGKNFWSVNAGLRMDVGARINKNMFTMMRDMNGFDIEDIAGTTASHNIGNQSVNMNAYAEVGLGFSRRITEKLSVGARAKVLLGLARAEANIEQFDVHYDIPEIPEYQNELMPEDWVGANYGYNAKANIVTTMKGGGMQFGGPDNTVDGFKLEGSSFGIAGSGFGIDLGASYKVLDNLTVSAAVLDLGFLKWSDKNTTVATASDREEITINNMEDYDKYIGGDMLSLDRFNFTKNQDTDYKSKTKLASTILLAGEYSLLHNKLSVGAMYTSRFAKPKTLNELTLMATFRPSNAFNIAASYSPIQSSGKSFGLALKLGPLFLGTDYMYFGNNSQSVNGFIGISIPLGGKLKPFAEI